MITGPQGRTRHVKSPVRFF